MRETVEQQTPGPPAARVQKVVEVVRVHRARGEQGEEGGQGACRRGWDRGQEEERPGGRRSESNSFQLKKKNLMVQVTV